MNILFLTRNRIFLIFSIFLYSHRSAASKTTKGMLHYNFSNYNPNTNLNAYLSSDAGESTSTDSDIGTSPSATTIASPPSSPQQLLPTSGQKASYANKPQQQANLNNSLIRQHSYLNAVQFNDFKLNQAQKSNPYFFP